MEEVIDIDELWASYIIHPLSVDLIRQKASLQGTLFRSGDVIEFRIDFNGVKELRMEYERPDMEIEKMELSEIYHKKRADGLYEVTAIFWVDEQCLTVLCSGFQAVRTNILA